jgi:hypothetical protein
VFLYNIIRYQVSLELAEGNNKSPVTSPTGDRSAEAGFGSLINWYLMWSVGAAHILCSSNLNLVAALVSGAAIVPNNRIMTKGVDR